MLHARGRTQGRNIVCVTVPRTRGTRSASTRIAEELPNVGLNIWGKEVALYGGDAFGGLCWDYVYAQDSTVRLSSSHCHLRQLDVY